MDTLDRLQALLDASDFDALAVFRAHSDGLRRRYGARLHTVEEPLSRFDLQAARGALRTLRGAAADAPGSGTRDPVGRGD